MPSVSSLAEASAVLGEATAAGTRLRIGEDLVTGGLDRLLEHEAGDLTCTVEAGMRLSTLQAELRPSGQRLSLDPPGDPTIGALIAENASGPLRHRFGAPRDLLLGVTLVLADGTIANAGGKVVKNVAGYDLSRLVCGSRGSLALVARASFRLHPLPTAARTLVVDTEDAAGVVAALLRSEVQPSTLDVLHPGRVAMLFEGSERAVEAQIRSATLLVGGIEAQHALWAEARERQGAAQGRLRFEPGELALTLGDLDEAVVRPAAGIAYTAESRLRGAEPRRALADDRLTTLLEAIKAQLDPNGILA